MDKIKLVVTQEKFDATFSIDDWFNFEKMPQNEIYEKMLMFVVDAQEHPVTKEEARSMFKKIPKVEWVGYVADFIRAVNDAFVNPTKGSS